MTPHFRAIPCYSPDEIAVMTCLSLHIPLHNLALAWMGKPQG